MAELSKIAQSTTDMIAAYDERKRTFDALRDLSMDDEKRAAAVEAYKKADREFNAAKNAVIK